MSDNIFEGRPDYWNFPAGGLQFPACHYCQHNQDNITCTAFPAGIPPYITLRQFDHLTSIDGDNGIVFTPRDDIDLPDRLK